jgi:hypothetical protein
LFELQITRENSEFIEMVMHKITEKDYAPLKQQLLDVCKNIQKKAIDSSKAAMDEAQQALNEYGPNKDRYDSFRDQLIGKRDMFAAQYQKALTECSVLKKIDPNIVSRQVEFGAIIVTDKSRFFVSISTGKIELDGNIYYAISPAVPLFKVMKGLAKGDVFEFNGMKQTITDLF